MHRASAQRGARRTGWTRRIIVDVVPIYEYRCQACDKRSSALLPRWDSPDPACPHCGQSQLRRLASTFAVAGRVDSESDDDFGGDEGYDGASEDEGDFGDDDW